MIRSFSKRILGAMYQHKHRPAYRLKRRLAERCVCIWLIAVTAVFGHMVAADASPIKLVSSIRPLTLIASELLGPELSTEIEVITLLQGQASPHHFALSASHARVLAEADLLLWVGPDFELFLAKAARSKSTVNFFDGEGSALTMYEQHDEHIQDLHLWLSLKQAQQFADRLVTALVAIRPDLELALQARKSLFNAQLAKLDTSLAASFAPLNSAAFVVYHDAYGPLVERYGLHQLGRMTEVPDEQISARRVASMMRQVEGKASCMVSELGEVAQAMRYASMMDLPLVSIDLLASETKVTTYSQYMLLLASQFVQCKKQ